MPWQFGALGLTENGGNRIIKYADAINHGVSRCPVPLLQYADGIKGFSQRRCARDD